MSRLLAANDALVSKAATTANTPRGKDKGKSPRKAQTPKTPHSRKSEAPTETPRKSKAEASDRTWMSRLSLEFLSLARMQAAQDELAQAVELCKQQPVGSTLAGTQLYKRLMAAIDTVAGLGSRAWQAELARERSSSSAESTAVGARSLERMFEDARWGFLGRSSTVGRQVGTLKKSRWSTDREHCDADQILGNPLMTLEGMRAFLEKNVEWAYLDASGKAKAVDGIERTAMLTRLDGLGDAHALALEEVEQLRKDFRKCDEEQRRALSGVEAIISARVRALEAGQARLTQLVDRLQEDMVEVKETVLDHDVVIGAFVTALADPGSSWKTVSASIKKAISTGPKSRPRLLAGLRATNAASATSHADLDRLLTLS